MYDSKASGSRRVARPWAKNFCHVWREDIVGSERSRGEFHIVGRPRRGIENPGIRWGEFLEVGDCC